MLDAIQSVVFAFAVGASAQQTTWMVEKHPELGLEFPRSREYEPIPIPPSEDCIVLSFAERGRSAARSEYERPRMIVLSLDAPSATPSGTGRDEPGKGEGAGRPSIGSLEEWVAQRLDGWKLQKHYDWPSKEKDWVQREYRLHQEPRPSSGPSRSGFAYAWIGAGRTVAIVGIATDADLLRHTAIWRRTAQRLSISEPKTPSTQSLRRIYERSSLRDPEFRVGVRQRLVRGWLAEDTENYIVVHHTADLAMVHRVMANLEVIRKEYERLFPPAQAISAVATVRICRDSSEYQSYGGPPDTGGFWSPVAQELVLYDAEKDPENKGRGDAATFLSVYHEALHQFVHVSSGELAPHSWFDEGNGDYFSGARVQGGKLIAIDPHPWRVDVVREAVKDGSSIPLRELLRLEQEQYYAVAAVDLCYAQGWALVYFLRTSERAKGDATWSRILPTYFEALKAAWADGREKLAAAGQAEDAVARDRAAKDARDRALDAALTGVDLEALESAWKEFVLALKPVRAR